MRQERELLISSKNRKVTGADFIHYHRKHTGHRKHSLPTKQEVTLHMDITRWSILKPD